MPSPLDLADLPFLREALVEVVLLAIAGVAVALGYAGGVERAGRAGRKPSEATALLLVAALATGVVLASDVFESGAAVDRLLFGQRLRPRPRPGPRHPGRGRGLAPAGARRRRGCRGHPRRGSAAGGRGLR